MNLAAEPLIPAGVVFRRRDRRDEGRAEMAEHHQNHDTMAMKCIATTSMSEYAITGSLSQEHTMFVPGVQRTSKHPVKK